MADYTVKKIDELDAAYGGAFKRARAELGVSAFGMQVMDLPPGMDGQFPEHDHAESGQEEVYLVLRGTCELGVDGERVKLDPDTIVRVGPASRRTFYTGDDPVRILALGGVPGGVYEAPEVTQVGGPNTVAPQN